MKAIVLIGEFMRKSLIQIYTCSCKILESGIKLQTAIYYDYFLNILSN